MKQRVVMVLSSLLDPSLLIADEVTSALDVSTQRAVAELLVEFRDRGFVKSMIVITHDLSVLYQIADTILVMYAGKLAEKAPAAEIVGAPRHPYTDLLLSSLPEVGVRFAEKRLRGIPGRPPSLLDPPAGCRFTPRCPLATDECGAEPPFATIAAGHRSRVLEGGGLMLEVDTCCKAYRVGAFGTGELLAVRDVSFSLGTGEVVSLIGESGSGKSTVGKMILRLLRTTGGAITFDGVDISTLEGQALRSYYRRRAGRLPGPVQLVQPDLQGRPCLRDDPLRLLRRARARPSGTRSSTRRSRR